jgi:hypothetical protein
MKIEDLYISYLNLDHRIDRLILIIQEFERVGLKAERTRGKLPKELDLDNPKFFTMKNRTVGACGCWEGQCDIMRKAYELGKSAWVNEDDLILATDIQERLKYIEGFVNEKEPDFDVIWMGGTVHINPHFWHTGINRDLPGSNLGRDAEYVGDKKMFRSYGSFSTHSYIVNHKSIPKILQMLSNIQHEAMGIDWAFIKLAPQLRNFVFLPGSVIQRDNMSDIGNGMTRFSGFASLGSHWFQDKVEDFNFDTYNWGEVVCS